MTICGTSNQGPVTLLECRLVKQHMQMVQGQPVRSEEMQPIFVIKGANLGPEEPQFNRARVRFTNLEAWWAKRAIQPGPDADSFTYSAPEPDRIQLADGASLTIGAQGTTHYSAFDAHMQQFTEVAVESPSLMPIRELSSNYIQPFQDLITLACDRPSAVTALWLSGPAIVDTAATRDGFVDVIGTPMYGLAPPTEADFIPLFTAALPPIGTEVLVRAWYELYQSAMIPLSILFSLRYTPQPVVDNRFLLVALVLESWHATLMNRPREKDEDAFAARKAAIVAQLDERYRDEVGRALTNELPFKGRIQDLLLRVQPSLNELITDVPQLARRFRDDRNDITHYHTGRRRPTGADMLELAQTGTAVMTADILLRLGFDTQAIRSSLALSLAYRQATFLAEARGAGAQDASAT
jgi:hypothetical protein